MACEIEWDGHQRLARVSEHEMASRNVLGIVARDPEVGHRSGSEFHHHEPFRFAIHSLLEHNSLSIGKQERSRGIKGVAIAQEKRGLTARGGHAVKTVPAAEDDHVLKAPVWVTTRGHREYRPTRCLNTHDLIHSLPERQPFSIRREGRVEGALRA